MIKPKVEKLEILSTNMIFKNNRDMLNFKGSGESKQEFDFRERYAKLASSSIGLGESESLILSSMALNYALTGCTYPIEYQEALEYVLTLLK